MQLSDIQKKDIINIKDGSKIGKIIDVEINVIDGKIFKFVIERSKFLKGIFNSENIVSIDFSHIKKIGEDVILVDLT
ncbi:MAG: YlmC/YmxH family sporulation protein [Bacilli bacterium]